MYTFKKLCCMEFHEYIAGNYEQMRKVAFSEQHDTIWHLIVCYGRPM